MQVEVEDEGWRGSPMDEPKDPPQLNSINTHSHERTLSLTHTLPPKRKCIAYCSLHRVFEALGGASLRFDHVKRKR